MKTTMSIEGPGCRQDRNNRADEHNGGIGRVLSQAVTAHPYILHVPYRIPRAGH
ncbi:hypothetical protein GLOTRDRAFT_110286 [Gloeophyllum trabeum ATCC 11539]|uniref:Uncharacterized protein n=1 Tax=Gloeophyllum trabeum (strain ATCC 11539 / FP-39264 / Madison 617) TaxID=670483 RepID=S7RV44_GLOTA|nr:uncharacterized protein GLOTRDRAFT_110286 [Gloeophyllum trabeum ATCC 11539]EPQ58640.1 hypothetical protein GLOTRDRAFT_110286 [Gloeophyllum trabeum ATCC 11539]